MNGDWMFSQVSTSSSAVRSQTLRLEKNQHRDGEEFWPADRRGVPLSDGRHFSGKFYPGEEPPLGPSAAQKHSRRRNGF